MHLLAREISSYVIEDTRTESDTSDRAYLIFTASFKGPSPAGIHDSQLERQIFIFEKTSILRDVEWRVSDPGYQSNPVLGGARFEAAHRPPETHPAAVRMLRTPLCGHGIP
jgi:hypothetical protein